MLWDCSSCGTKKLLGKTHRRCPSCGAPQDEAKRYFPLPGEEVEAKDHVFVGADWHCAACTTPNSKAASFCTNCGNPRDEGNKDVNRAADLVDDKPVAPVVAPKTSGGFPWLPVAAVAGLVVVGVTVAMCWQKDDAVRVESHRWSRDIDVEVYSPHIDSSWCDQMPFGAYNVTHTREQRSTKQIPDGQDCHTRSVDNGDGTFHKSSECTTKYRSEPVYDDRCHYTIDRWGHERTAHAEGIGIAPAPSWPATHLSRTGSCIGCEREGSRTEKLTVELRDAAGKTFHCDVDDARWQRLRDGAAADLKVRVVTGGAVCSSLR
jgi:hypothetical protein